MSEQLMGMAADLMQAQAQASDRALEEARLQLEAEFNRPEMIEAINDDDTPSFERPIEQHTSENPVAGCYCANCRPVPEVEREGWSWRDAASEALAEPVTAASIISADDVMRRLLELPREIEEAEVDLIDAERGLMLAERTRQWAADDLLLQGTIDGKNADLREAQLRKALRPVEVDLGAHRGVVRERKRRHQALVNEFSALKAIARLLEGGRE